MDKSEDRILSDFHLWMWENEPDLRRLCFHPNNEANLGPLVGAMNKAKGVVAGVADYIMLVPNQTSHGLCIEFKRPGETQSDKQIDFEMKVVGQGFKYEIAFTTEQAIEIWNQYRN
jgi:hypothetical protein